MTILDSAELPLESGTEAHSTAKFTEEQARQWLAERGDSSVRQLAKLWGWHPSKVQRCLSRVVRRRVECVFPWHSVDGEPHPA